MSEDDGVEITPEDAVEVARNAMKRAGDVEATAQRALAKVNELEEENEALRDRLTALELRYEDFDEDRTYDDLDTDGHVGRVREHAFERATDGHGRATLDYNDIKWGVFDGEPSAHYCYKLMRLAATAPGFQFRNPDGKGKALLVDAQEARTGTAFSSANKTDPRGARSE